MLIIQQQKSAICLTVLVIAFLDLTSAEKSTSNQRICGNRNTRTISYFQVSSEPVNWTEAWRLCNNNRSNLPVICNQQEQDALAKYLKANTGISAAWTSGKKIKFDDWTWIDGQPFNTWSRGVKPRPNDDYNTHGALDEKRTYKAENPSNTPYYLCQYSGSSCNNTNVVRARNTCISIHNGEGDDRPWYDARNQCLTNGGDLAILDDADLGTLINSSQLSRKQISYWIGLRKNAWHWQTTAPLGDSGEAVKYSNWPNPHSLSGECISIDASNGGWKAVTCTDGKRVVCQANETTSSRSSIISDTTSTISNTMFSTTIREISSVSEGTTQSTANVLLYSGVGAGIVIIIICIIVIILAIRYTRKPHKDMNRSKVKNNSEQNFRLDLSPQKPASTSPASAPANTTANASANAPVAGADDTQGLYAEISLATLNQREDGAKTEQPGVVYAALEFQKEPTYLEPDKKRAHTTDQTKVAPMGDIIYAIPDAKGHAATSSGNESASHPSKVAPQGDVYALPLKNSKSPTENPSGGGIYENL